MRFAIPDGVYVGSERDIDRLERIMDAACLRLAGGLRALGGRQLFVSDALREREVRIVSDGDVKHFFLHDA